LLVGWGRGLKNWKTKKEK